MLKNFNSVLEPLMPQRSCPVLSHPISKPEQREWASLRKEVGTNIVCKQCSQGEKAVNY